MNLATIRTLRISVASSEQIRSWSSGEVTRAETINYRTGQPEAGGLFCECIFGPTKDWTCACGTYRRTTHRQPSPPGVCCERCGVAVTTSRVRRERMGHIELAVPVAHPWFSRGHPSIIATLLNLAPRQLAEVLACSASLVTSIDEAERCHQLSHAETLRKEQAALLTSLTIGLVLSDTQEASSLPWRGSIFDTATGAAAVQRCLEALDLDALVTALRQDQRDSGNKRTVRRLEVAEAFRASGVNPAWMILSVLPVLPPDLRPLVPLEPGSYATSDVNALYERVLHRNVRVKRLLDLGAPTVILRNEQRLLQDACNALFDNAHLSHPRLGSHGQPLKSLSDRLSGKEGRLRRNLLGKRVDYSGRSVIVGNPDLRLPQCGLPLPVCLELFQPFLVGPLLERQIVGSVREAQRLLARVRRPDPVLVEILDEVMAGKVVLLNRAPTLHRLSLQAFEPVLVEGSAIQLHPLVCSAFNADFDGDQMAVHLPLSDDAQAEARARLLVTQNLRSPATGDPTISMSQEMVLGLFYLTQERPSDKQANRLFADATEALLALEANVIDIHTRIAVRNALPAIDSTPGSTHEPGAGKTIATTAGRLIFNAYLPGPLHFKNEAMTKDALKQLVAECLRLCGDEATTQLVDRLKTLGFHYATISGFSVALSDIVIPREKPAILAAADAEVAEVEDQLQAGLITADERYQKLIGIWTRATEEIAHHVEAQLDPWGSLATIITSGATKAKFQQIRQLCGMRGLMASPSGRIIEIPIKSNYKEGMSVRDGVTGGSAARNGFMGRSLSTAITGHLTRRLVETGMEVWITMSDCGDTNGLLVTNAESQAQGLPDMRSRLLGRVLCEPLGDLPAGSLLDALQAARIATSGITAVRVRSVLSCQARSGVCQHCYGSDLARGKLVQLGTAVGVIAGQSIGEPGTQLSMRAFHAGGIANAAGDIRQGLPRVIELFEARIPPHPALLATLRGTARIEREDPSGRLILHVVPPAELGPVAQEWRTMLQVNQKPAVEQGTPIEIGTPLTYGACDPHAMLALLGTEATARYLVNEVQRVFRATGVYLHDKHVECIVRQMLRCVAVRDPGETALLPDTIIERTRFLRANETVLTEGGAPAMASPVLLGLTQTALHTSSWLAAASFQGTNRVLAQAAIRGQRDPLWGIKERVIVGLPLPHPAEEEAGTSPPDDCALVQQLDGTGVGARRAPG